MPTPRFNEKEFFSAALMNYETMGRPINIEEFKQEANRAMHIPRFMKKLKNETPDEKQIRLLVNYFVIAFNNFGKGTQSLLFTVADESIYPEIIAILYFLKRYPESGKVFTITNQEIDLDSYCSAVDFLEVIQ